MPSFTIERTLADVPRALDRARAEAKKFGSTWEGDTERGRYDLRTPLGRLTGTYTVVEQRITFAIDQKPMIVPRALIERVLDAFLRAG